jgi:hypothetical protein
MKSINSFSLSYKIEKEKNRKMMGRKLQLALLKSSPSPPQKNLVIHKRITFGIFIWLDRAEKALQNGMKRLF